MKPKFSLLVNNHELVHASINISLKSLKPMYLGYVFATDNLSFAIISALRLAFPYNSVRMQTYSIFGTQYVFTSLANEHCHNILNRELKLYYCDKINFNQYVKIESNLSNYTFNIIKTLGHEYVTRNEVFPNKGLELTIKNNLNYSTHNMSDNKKLIIIKALFNYLIYRKKCITKIN